MDGALNKVGARPIKLAGSAQLPGRHQSRPRRSPAQVAAHNWLTVADPRPQATLRVQDSFWRELARTCFSSLQCTCLSLALARGQEAWPAAGSVIEHCHDRRQRGQDKAVEAVVKAVL